MQVLESYIVHQHSERRITRLASHRAWSLKMTV